MKRNPRQIVLIKGQDLLGPVDRVLALLPLNVLESEVQTALSLAADCWPGWLVAAEHQGDFHFPDKWLRYLWAGNLPIELETFP